MCGCWCLRSKDVQVYEYRRRNGGFKWDKSMRLSGKVGQKSRRSIRVGRTKLLRHRKRARKARSFVPVLKRIMRITLGRRVGKDGFYKD